MLRYLFFLAISSFAYCGEAKSKLHGTWQSDGPVTVKYLTEHCILNDQQRKVFPRLFGNSRITFRPDGTGVMLMGANKFPKPDGGELVVEERTMKFTY